MPEQTDQRALEPLEEFLLEQTSRLEFLDPNSPQYKSLKDALLVAESMQFIKDNEELIKRIIDCKNNKQAYLADEYIKSHYADRAEQDFENKVLRALNGVSFHIDYQSPELGWQALAGLVYQFETAIVTAREQNVTDELINKLRYDRNRGCIEERVSNALLYAGRLLSGEVSFDDEFARVYERLSTTRQTDQEKYSLALWHFASNDLLGKDVIINKTTRDILVAGGIAEEQFEAFLDTQGGQAYKFKLTPEIIKSYLIAMGELSESFTSADDYKKTIYQEVYAEKDVDIVLGKANPPMLQHRFKDYDDAIKFLQWLQSEPELKEVGILKAKVTEESGQFVIHLSGEQVDKVLGADSYNKLQAGVSLDILTGVVNRDLVPIRRLSQLKQEQLAKKYLEQPCLFKTVTGFADKKAWQQVIDDMTNSEIKAQGVKTLFRRERDSSKRYEVRLVSRLGEPARYDVFDAMPENGVGRKRNYEEWKKEMGGELPSYHSWTYANPSNPAFNPPYFGHQHNYPAVVGIRNSLSHKTMDGQVVNHARVKAIFSVDGGTYGRPNAFATIQKAQSYIQSQRNASLLTSYSELEGQTVINRPNETLAGFFWRCDGSSQVVAFRDNLESRLLAQLRALDIQARLDKYPEKYSQSQYGYYSGYKVPVSVWGAGGKGCRLYSQAEQEQDLQAECTGVAKQYQTIIELLRNPELQSAPAIDVVDLVSSLGNISDITLAEISILAMKIKLIALIGDKDKKSKFIEETLIDKDQKGFSLVQSVCEHQPTAIPLLIGLISQIDDVTKREQLIERILTEKMLTEQSALGFNVFMLACAKQPTAIPFLIGLISQIDDVTERKQLIEKMLTEKAKNGYNAFMLACAKQPTAIPLLIGLISQIDDVTKREQLIEKMLTEKDSLFFGLNALLLACGKQPTAVPSLIGLVSKIEDVAKRDALIETMLTEKNSYDDSALLLACLYQPTAIPSLIELVSKVENAEKREALIRTMLAEKNKGGHSPLMMACYSQPTAIPALIELVSKIEDVAKREALIEKLLTEKDENLDSALMLACKKQPTAIPLLIGLISQIDDVTKRNQLIWLMLTQQSRQGHNALILACLQQPTAIPSLIELGTKFENSTARGELLKEMSGPLTDDQIKSILSNKAMIRQIAALPVESEFPIFFSLLKTEAGRFIGANEKQTQAVTKDFMRTLKIQQGLIDIVDRDSTPQEKIIAILKRYIEGGLFSMRSKTQKVKEILNHIRPDQSLEEMMVEIRARLGGLDMNLGEHLYSYNLVIEAIATQAIAKQEEQAPIQSSQGLVGFLRQSPAAAAADAHSGIEEAPMRPGP